MGNLWTILDWMVYSLFTGHGMHCVLPVKQVVMEPTIRVKPSYLLELQGRAVMAEKAVREKEDENVMLRQKLQHYEARWLEYEAKTSSMEELWQKQMTSLQLSLAAAKRSLAAVEPVPHTPKNKDETMNVCISGRRHQNHATRHMLAHDEDDFDWDDDTTVGNKSPDLVSKCHHQKPEYMYGAEVEAGRSVVGHLVREFDHRTEVFNDDVDFLVEVKSGVTEASLSPEEELRKLKARFDTWKKDFKGRMRDTRLVLQRLSNVESNERAKKKWWGKRTTPWILIWISHYSWMLIISKLFRWNPSWPPSILLVSLTSTVQLSSW